MFSSKNMKRTVFKYKIVRQNNHAILHNQFSIIKKNVFSIEWLDSVIDVQSTTKVVLIVQNYCLLIFVNIIETATLWKHFREPTTPKHKINRTTLSLHLKHLADCLRVYLSKPSTAVTEKYTYNPRVLNKDKSQFIITNISIKTTREMDEWKCTQRNTQKLYDCQKLRLHNWW